MCIRESLHLSAAFLLERIYTSCTWVVFVLSRGTITNQRNSQPRAIIVVDIELHRASCCDPLQISRNMRAEIVENAKKMLSRRHRCKGATVAASGKAAQSLPRLCPC